MRRGAVEDGGADVESAEKMELGASEVMGCDHKAPPFKKMHAAAENSGGKLLMKNRHKTDIKPT